MVLIQNIPICRWYICNVEKLDKTFLNSGGAGMDHLIDSSICRARLGVKPFIPIMLEQPCTAQINRHDLATATRVP